MNVARQDKSLAFDKYHQSSSRNCEESLDLMHIDGMKIGYYDLQ